MAHKMCEPYRVPCGPPYSYKFSTFFIIIFDNLCPLIRPNFLHRGTIVPREVGLASQPTLARVGPFQIRREPYAAPATARIE